MNALGTCVSIIAIFLGLGISYICARRSIVAWSQGSSLRSDLARACVHEHKLVGHEVLDQYSDQRESEHQDWRDSRPKEQVAGNFGLGIAAFLAYLAAAGIIVLLFPALSPLGGVGIATTILIGVVLVAGVAPTFATMGGIYKAALYTCAATGEVPSLFPDDAIRRAFRPRES